MTPWNQVASSPGRVPELRASYLNMAATGLVVIGRVAHHINTTIDSEDERRNKYLALAQQVDWRRNAPIWQGNIITNDKVATQRAPVRRAAEEVEYAIGLRPDRPSVGLSEAEAA